MRLIFFLAVVSITPIPLQAQVRVAKYHHRDVWQLESKELRVSVTQVGGHIAEIVLKGPREVNPLWLQARPTIDPTEYVAEKHERFYGGGSGAKLMSGRLGHSLCFPYWGNPSESEHRAGMSFHGETGVVPWTRLSEKTEDALMEIKLAADLPESKTRFIRTVSLVTGEAVVYFNNRAENLAALDRPVGWCEHVTVGPPFLKKGVTLFDAALTRGRKNGDLTGREFLWPTGQAETLIDLRIVRTIDRSGLVNNFLVDPTRVYGYFAAVNPEMNLLFGYLFRRVDFPWLNLWEANTSTTKDQPAMLTRGLEFSNTPTHGSMKALLKAPRLFEVPTFEWLDAKSTLIKKFCAFSARVPNGFLGVQEIKVEPDRLDIVEREKGRVVKVPFQRQRLE